MVDLNGGETERGDVLEYTVQVTNVGGDPAVDLRLFDPIPAQTRYVPDSLEVTPAVTVGPPDACGTFEEQPDGLGTGLADFEADAGRTVFRLGEDANEADGGFLRPSETVCARFRVQVADDAPRTSEIVNQASASFLGLTLGTQFPDEPSNPVTNVVSGRRPRTEQEPHRGLHRR